MENDMVIFKIVPRQILRYTYTPKDAMINGDNLSQQIENGIKTEFSKIIWLSSLTLGKIIFGFQFLPLRKDVLPQFWK